MLRSLGVLITVLFACTAAVVTWPGFFRLAHTVPFAQIVAAREATETTTAASTDTASTGTASTATPSTATGSTATKAGPASGTATATPDDDATDSDGAPARD